MSLEKLPFNWFDIAVVLILLIGVQRGRKRGMSEEMLTMLRWVALVVVCGFLYDPVGQFIANEQVFNLVISYVMAYVALALGVAIVFALLKRAIGGKLVGSDVFGNGEYYLGMPSGMVRFACVLIAVLALLNAREYSTTEIKARQVYVKDVYGKDYWPTLQAVQAAVFEQSFIGPYIKNHLGFLLIKPTAWENMESRRKEFQMP